jgi:hypothetical protein
VTRHVRCVCAAVARPPPPTHTHIQAIELATKHKTCIVYGALPAETRRHQVRVAAFVLLLLCGHLTAKLHRRQRATCTDDAVSASHTHLAHCPACIRRACSTAPPRVWMCSLQVTPLDWGSTSTSGAWVRDGLRAHCGRCCQRSRQPAHAWLAHTHTRVRAHAADTRTVRSVCARLHAGV